MKHNKLFVIGAHKTGTTSLGHALRILKIKHNGLHNYHQIIQWWLDKNFQALFNYCAQFPAFSDSPWNHTDFYQTLDKRFPNSGFILTERDSDEWFDSMQSFVQRRGGLNKMPQGRKTHKLLYGNDQLLITDDMKQQYVKQYELRNQQIRSYFRERADGLLVLNLKQQAAQLWDLLCEFTGSTIPTNPFPYTNVRPK